MQRFLNLPITKVDEVQRIVYGTAALEQVDKVREILDYETSKPHFQAWSEEFAKATNGESLGNVREMHDPKTAAGKVISFVANDAKKSFDVGVKVVDDTAWAKVTNHVYTGFSLGGEYQKRWDDPNLKGVKRYTAKPFEISLVDSPCIPGATIEIVKATGAIEKYVYPSERDRFRLMRKVLAVTKFAGEDAKPLAENCIKNFYPNTVSVFKSMWDISRLADALQTIACIEDCLESQRDWDGIDTEIPEMLGDMLIRFKPIFLALASEEIERLVKEEEREATQKLFNDVNGEMDRVIKSIDASGKNEKTGKVIAMTLKEWKEKMEKAVTSAASLDELKKNTPGLLVEFESLLKASSVKEGEGTDDLKNKNKVKQGEGGEMTDEKTVTAVITKMFGVESSEVLTKAFTEITALRKSHDELEKIVETQGELLNKVTAVVTGTPLPAKAAVAAGAPVEKTTDGTKPVDTKVKKAYGEYKRSELEKMSQSEREELIAEAFRNAQQSPQVGQPFPVS